MQEIAKVLLENEMDLVLAHKRSMRLAELAGLSLSAQTTFATAVSEVARGTMDNASNGFISLGISINGRKEKFIVASIKEKADTETLNPGIEYAKRLVNNIKVAHVNGYSLTDLYYKIPHAEKITAKQIEEWKDQFTEVQLSAYDEIKKKNEQLHILAEKLQESDAQYKTLTSTLPLLIFSLDKDRKFVYANKWLEHFSGMKLDQLNDSGWKTMIHEEDYPAFSVLMNNHIAGDINEIKTQIRLKQADSNNYLWHLFSVLPLKDDHENVIQWIGYCVDINAQKIYEQTLKDNEELKQTKLLLEQKKMQLERNIQELNRSNDELQQFAFIASHDLQEPVRKVSVYSDYLITKYKDHFDKRGNDYLKGLVSASERMRNLIHDVLSYSLVTKEKITFAEVDVKGILTTVLEDLDVAIKQKGAEVKVVGGFPRIEADKSMLIQLFENIISNAIKYSKQDVRPIVLVKGEEKDKHLIISVSDNGIGFDNRFANKIFNLFHRLHAKDKYEGTGIGLAICKKIVEIHHGQISAQGIANEGATFIINLPVVQ